MKPLSRAIVFAAAATIAAPLFAASSNVYRTDGWGDFEFEEKPDWRESKVEVPPPPRDGDLLEVSLDIPRYTFYLDTEHLTLGADEVIRYTVVVKSTSGAENIFFEGLRCSEKLYRSYAFGASDGSLRAMEGSEWKVVRAAETNPFRFEMARFYFCDEHTLPRTPEQIIERIKYADHEDFRF